MKTNKFLALLSLVALLFFVSLASAQDTNSGGPATLSEGALEAIPSAGPASPLIQFDLGPGTGPPPPTLGGLPMIPVPDPGAPGCTGIAPPGPIPTPGGGIDVNPWDSPRCIGVGWATWSHGYTGDVYFTGGAAQQTITLPPGTRAFYFYVEPDPFAVHRFIVQAQPGGAVSPVFSADGQGGAVYVGVFEDGAGTIDSVTIFSIDQVGFATGEYGIGGAAEPVGAELTGQAGVLAICQNRTTGQRVFGVLGGSKSVDCEALGLAVGPGDAILLITIGTAE